MESTLRNQDTQNTDPQTRQPEDDRARRLGDTLSTIGEDARQRAESYPAETLVPEGGE